MKQRVLTAIYWLVALVIGFGAFGHGFVGVKPVRAALEAVTVPADIRAVIWIVWYFVSGCMLTFASLIIWAWFAHRRGALHALAVPITIAVFWTTTGIAAFAYQHNPFWLLFFAEGIVLLGTSL